MLDSLLFESPSFGNQNRWERRVPKKLSRLVTSILENIEYGINIMKNMKWQFFVLQFNARNPYPPPLPQHSWLKLTPPNLFGLMCGRWLWNWIWRCRKSWQTSNSVDKSKSSESEQGREKPQRAITNRCPEFSLKSWRRVMHSFDFPWSLWGV